MLFLAVIGGAVVLEVHRALQHGGNPDVKEMKEREAQLRKQLKDIQRDLRAAEQQRQLTESEAAQLAAVNTRLSAENASLAEAATGLRAENEELLARADSLQARQAALEAAAESLKLENGALTAQFDRLKVRYEAEAAGFEAQVAELKAAVGGALSRFTAGDISADQLVAYLSAMGVELRGREGLSSLPEQLNSARSAEERVKLLDRCELEVGDGWLQQMRLTAAEPGRAARLLMAGAAARSTAAAAAGSSAAVGLLEAGGSNPLSPPRKLPTPPKERSAAQLPRVPALKLPLGDSAGASSSGSGSGAPAALAAAPAADENAASNSAAAPAQAGKAGDGKKGGAAIRFLPGKKAARKQAVQLGAAQPQLALDVPLGSQSAATAMPRLPFDAVGEDLDLPGTRNIVAL